MNRTSVALELNKAKKKGYAVGAFNIFNEISARAVIAAAVELRKPVILQTSVGTVDYYGAEELYGMAERLIKKADVPVYLHLDHCTSVEAAARCVDAGWDSIMIDASRYCMEENIRITKEAADYAHLHNVTVEGEVGIIEGVEEEIAAAEGKPASYEDCLYFAEESHIDLLAPALGTAHGVYQGRPSIHFQLAGRLGKGLQKPVVCHGGTGLSEETFGRLIRSGVAKINVSTALKCAYIDGAKRYLADTPVEYAPLKMDELIYVTMKETAKHHIRMFSKER